MSDTTFTSTTTTKLTDLSAETQFKVAMLESKGTIFVARIGEETAEYLRQYHLSSVYALNVTKTELPEESYWLRADKNWAADQHPLYLFSSLRMYEVDGQYVLMTGAPNCPYNAMTLSKINIRTRALAPFVLDRFADLTWDRFLSWVRNNTGLTVDEALAIADAATEVR